MKKTAISNNVMQAVGKDDAVLLESIVMTQHPYRGKAAFPVTALSLWPLPKSSCI
jgi:hypothetical protein